MEWYNLFGSSNSSSEDEFPFSPFKEREDDDYLTQNSPSSNIIECKPPPDLISECKPPPDLISQCKHPPDLISECKHPPDLISECKHPPDLISGYKKEPPTLNLNNNNQQIDHNFSQTDLFQFLPHDRLFYFQQPVPRSTILNSNKEFVNNCKLEKGKSFSAAKKPKRKIFLSANHQNFKKNFNSFFTSRKKINKQSVKKIHDYIADELGIPKMSREQYRVIDLYFRDFAQYSDKIIPYLKENKDELSKLIN